MAIKSEISWKRPTDDGRKIEVYARRVGGEWRFYWRHRRHDLWQVVARPPLEDWLELADAIERRIPRGLYPPDELDRVRSAIRNRFPQHGSCDTSGEPTPPSNPPPLPGV